MIKLSYTDSAQSDLIEFYESLVRQVGGLFAEAGLEAMLDRCEDLARYPDMGRRRPDLDSLGFSAYSISESGRQIVYTRRIDTLHVVRVFQEESGL